MPTLKEAATFWEDVLRDIKARVQQTQYDTWFAKTNCCEVGDDHVVIDVPTSFYQDWLLLQYAQMMREVIGSLLGCDNPRLSFRVGNGRAVAGVPERHAPSDSAASSSHDAMPRPAEPQSPPRRGAGARELDLQLNPDYTFANFVVGASNRLAHAAAMAVVEDIGRVYNPFFIYGGLGLGKTHLLQAICHALLAARPNLRLHYVPCEQFVNRFIAALEKGKGQLEAFRAHFRMVDVLLVDDIHFLRNKEHTQEEFFHTFNALYNEQKQIILSSDSGPKDIPTIEDRLVSRFKWGLVCEIESPTFETRLAIIRKKANKSGVQIPDDVAEFMAANLKKSIREIEGAVTSMLGYSQIMNQPMSLDTARFVLGDVATVRRRRITMDRIISAVTEQFGVKLSDLQSKKRHQSVTLPRQVCMFLARRYTNHSLSEIGGYFGGRDHTTVLHSAEKIAARIDEDADLEAMISEITKILETP